MSASMSWKVASICGGLRRTDDREVIADALTQVAAIPCSPEGLQLRASVAEGGGLESISSSLLATHGDVRLQCKAANALGSLCMSKDVARSFPATASSSAVLDRLGDMLRSRSQWAQADAVGCLGWLIGNIATKALEEFVPLVAQLMTKHMETDDEFFIRQERQREERATWGRDRQPSSGGGRDGADVGRGSGRREANSKRRIEEGGSKEEVARERMDNIRVYSLIFLLKVAHADHSTMPVMVEAGATSGLLRHLATEPFGKYSIQAPRRSEGAFGYDRASEESLGPCEPPSLLLAARLLYAFALDPDVRASLLREKCLPPLIRIRQRLRDRPGPTTSTTPALKKYTPRHPPPRPDDRSSDLGNGRRDKVGAEGQPVVRGREVTGDENDGRGSVGAAGGGDAQPRLEAMVGLIIDEMVGKSSSVR